MWRRPRDGKDAALATAKGRTGGGRAEVERSAGI